MARVASVRGEEFIYDFSKNVKRKNNYRSAVWENAAFDVAAFLGFTGEPEYCEACIGGRSPLIGEIISPGG